MSSVRVVATRLRLPSTWLSRSLLNSGKFRLLSAVADGAPVADPTKKLRTAFLLYVAEQEKAQKAPEFRTVTERSKYFSEQWKQLTTEEKERYKTVAAEAQAQYKMELQKEISSHPERAALQKEVKRARLFKLRVKEVEQERVANLMPRRPPSSFGLFVEEYCKSGKREDTTNMNLLNNASLEWKQLAADDKQKYVDEAAKRRNEYIANVGAWSERMKAEGKTHLIPGHEPVMSIRRQSPFAQVMIKSIETATGDSLDNATVRAVLAFVGEQLTTLKSEEEIDVMQVIQLWTYTWIRLTSEQKARYLVGEAAPRAAAARNEDRVDKAGSKQPEDATGVAAKERDAERQAADTLEPDSATITTRRRSSRTRATADAAKSVVREHQPAAAGDTAAAEAGGKKSPGQKKKKRPTDANTTSTDSE